MNARRLFSLILVLTLLSTLTGTTSSAPLAGPCVPGAAYDPACDANQDGTITVNDIQLTAGHWNQTGTFVSDSNHTHLGQTWTGANNPIKIQGAFGAPDHAPLVLSNSTGTGLRITSATNNGVQVDSAGDAGVQVSSAGINGVAVLLAGSSGVYVESVASTGVYVDSAGDDGIYVRAAGSPTTQFSSGNNNGFEVAGAQGDGLYVGRADHYGVYVASAGWDGVQAQSASAGHFGGHFLNQVNGGSGVRAEGGSNEAPDLVLGGFGAEDDGRIYSEPSLSGSDILLYSNDVVQIDLDEDNNSTSAFNIRNGANTVVWTVSETGLAVAGGVSATAVTTGEHDQRLLYAVHSPQPWFEDFGSGQLVDGEAVVLLEPIYAATIETTPSYHVFLTPLGDCALYVATKTPAAFIVRAVDDKPCAVAFDYRIVALRKGSAGQRLEAFAAPAD